MERIALINIDSEIFSSAKENLNILLQKTLQDMLQKNSDEGSVTLKINIEIDRQEDLTNENETLIPNFHHKCTGKIGLKRELEDVYNGDTNGSELVWDGATNQFIIVSMDDGQTAMF